MKKKRYDQEFKEQIVRECQEVGNAGLRKDTILNCFSALSD